MHVGKFYAAIDAIDSEFRQKKILETLNAVIAQLNASVSNPGNADQAKAFRDHYQQLRSLLENSKLNNPHPTRRAIFNEIGAGKFLGNGLLSVIEQSINANNLAPSLAVQELQKVHADATKFLQVISSINKGFSALKIECDALEPNEAELGISIPRELVESDFPSFVRELKQYSSALTVFNEVVTDNRETLTVKTISSSDWQLYLLGAPLVLGALSSALKDVADILRSLVDLKKSWSELTAKGVPDDVIAPIKQYADDSSEKNFRKLAEKIIDEHYTKDDPARKNELCNYLTQSLKFIANKMDIGVTIDITICPPEKPDADPETPEGAAAIKQFNEDKALADKVNHQALLVAEFSEQKGEPLKLPTSDLEKE